MTVSTVVVMTRPDLNDPFFYNSAYFLDIKPELVLLASSYQTSFTTEFSEDGLSLTRRNVYESDQKRIEFRNELLQRYPDFETTRQLYCEVHEHTISVSVIDDTDDTDTAI
jgi:hypothetical protein